MSDPSPGFPDAHSLCEQCGYNLQGLAAAGDCPECGSPIRDSDPAHRPGLPFQISVTPYRLLQTLWMVTFKPRRSFRAMRVNLGGESAWPERLYLLQFALFVGLFWWIAGYLAGIHNSGIEGPAAAGAVVALTYIEALGVAFFSSRRGWRVGWRTAERVACYSAGAWVPAGLVMFKVRLLQSAGVFDNLWPAAVTALRPYTDFVFMVLIGGVSILWFESLVWLGVKQVKFGNAPSQQPRVNPQLN